MVSSISSEFSLQAIYHFQFSFLIFLKFEWPNLSHTCSYQVYEGDYSNVKSLTLF